MVQKNDQPEKHDIRLTEALKNIRVPLGQECDDRLRVQCPDSSRTYCVYEITEITPSEIDYKCPECGRIVKKDVMTPHGWDTLVLDSRHVP